MYPVYSSLRDHFDQWKHIRSLRGLVDAHIRKALVYASFLAWGKIRLRLRWINIRSHCYIIITSVAVRIELK